MKRRPHSEGSLGIRIVLGGCGGQALVALTHAVFPIWTGRLIRLVWYSGGACGYHGAYLLVSRVIQLS